MLSRGELASALDLRVAALWRTVARPAHRELSRTAGSVLASLRDRGPQRVTELAATEAVAQPTMTNLVGRLERAGHVSRTADPDDRRAVLVSITEAGREVLERSGAARHELLSAHLAALGREDRARLEAALPALDALIDHLEHA